MKFTKKLTTAAAAAVLCVTSATPAYTVAETSAVVYDGQGNISFSLEVNENTPRFGSVDEAAEFVKAQLKQHVTEFDLLVTDWVPADEDNDITDCISEKLIIITDDPTEGLYLSLTSNITCGCLYPSEGAYAKYNVEYYNTPEEEAELTEVIDNLKDTPEYIAVKDSDIYDKILWAYDIVVSNMDIHEDLMDSDYCTAYSAVIKKKANESGQVHFLIRLLQEIGVQPMLYLTNLSSLSNDGIGCHLLVMAQIDDKFYFLDPVWDHLMGGSQHRFFLKGYTDLDSESDGSDEFTHIHLFQLFGIPIEEAMQDSEMAPTAYVKPDTSSYTDGDVNGDGEVNAVDASLVLREYALLSGETQSGSFTDAQKKAADIDENGFVDAVDASRILSYYAYVSTIEEGVAPEGIKEHSIK
ncbi:dockerin type I domain-containing protein [Ruminococcus sp.]|uniref:dockerin type I domain-containing protein n=1 Tax=Ruminococcus sp. TaxID=41978 RepID=UPI001B737ED3|nr:dockerin type I domain-containing protein [Ruminococcus sp.]MBP5430847.1 hypothetical protein [Ruminococcus sp.]